MRLFFFCSFFLINGLRCGGRLCLTFITMLVDRKAHTIAFGVFGLVLHKIGLSCTQDLSFYVIQLLIQWFHMHINLLSEFVWWFFTSILWFSVPKHSPTSQMLLLWLQYTYTIFNKAIEHTNRTLMSNRATLLRGVDFSFFFEGFVLLLKWFPPQWGDSSTPTLQQMKEYLMFTPSSWVDFYISTFYPSHNQTNHNWITCKNLFLFFKWRVSSSFNTSIIIIV